MSRSRYTTKAASPVLALIVYSVIAGAAAASGPCLSVNLEVPVVLPAGEVHPAGQLTLCLNSHYSPVSSLHETYVDGKSVGLLMSRRGKSEATADQIGQPFIMFFKDRHGRLHLYGYATPAHDRLVTYRLADEPHVTLAWPGDDNAFPDSRTPVAKGRTGEEREARPVLITARTN